MNKFNISKPKKYTAKSGEERTFWQNVGTLTEFEKQDGSISRIIEIPAIGLEAHVFPIRDQEQTETDKKQNEVMKEQKKDEEAEEVDIDDIPF